jgi:hypothetical protein
MQTRLRDYSRHCVRALNAAALAAITGLMLTACQQDQPTSPPAASDGEETIIDFKLTPEGAAAAQRAAMIGTHKLPTLALRQETISKISASVGRIDNSPFDLTRFAGRVVRGATSYNIYVNCVSPDTPATCWGTGDLTPTTFLRDLNRSNFIRLANEYIGQDAQLQFPAEGMRVQAAFATPNKPSLQEIQHIVADAVLRTGISGYKAIYHVFLPQGTSVCIIPGNCYSPEDPASWTFCAFHGSVNFSATQHVLFTVQPYQGVAGCQVPGQTPNGLIDATASTLSHELFETITDPDFDGWFNTLFGFEMSDLCSTFGSNQLVSFHSYFLQSEYSNTKHMCTSEAPA